MAPEEQHQIEISCPNCTEKGVINFSKEDFTTVKKQHKQVESIDGNFTVIITMSEDDDITIKCEACGNGLVV